VDNNCQVQIGLDVELQYSTALMLWTFITYNTILQLVTSKISFT